MVLKNHLKLERILKKVFINNFDLKTSYCEDIHNYLDKSIIQDPPINLKDEIIIPKATNLDETIETRNNSKNIMKQKIFSYTKN